MEYTERKRLESLWRTSLVESYKDSPKLHNIIKEVDIHITLHVDYLSILLYVETDADKEHLPTDVQYDIKNRLQNISGVEPVELIVISYEELPF